jgi:glutamine amidotransferase
MKIGIVNYGLGNLASVRRTLEELGATPYIANSPSDLGHVDRIIIPGVGAFPLAMKNLREQGWIDALRYQVLELHCPLLGICLGMQLLATNGEEGGWTEGLGLIAGTVKRLDVLGSTLRIPHAGWNEVVHTGDDPLFNAIPQQSDFYFVHSFAFSPTHLESVIATTDYGVSIVVAVRHKHVWGVQFHPEKSSKAGRRLIKNFLDVRAC